MAALVPAAATAHLYSDAMTQMVQAGEAIAFGASVWQDTDGKWYNCDADDADEPVQVGVAWSVAEADEDWFVVVLEGGVDLGCAVAVGTPYFVHTTAGAIGVYGDLASSDYVTFLGIGTTTSRLQLKPLASEAAIP